MEPLDRQKQVLDATLRVTAPLVRLLVHHGVGYQNFAASLKPVFLEQALAQILAQGDKDTDSALSLRSGIHRKDIAAWRVNPQPTKKAVRRSVPAEVFAQWINDPELNTPDGPRALRRSGPAPSFEALSRRVNQDVHPLTILNELLRLGLARLEADTDGADCVALVATAYVPTHDWEQTLELFVENLRAHVETAARNLGSTTPPHLEQAAYAGGLTDRSAQALSELSRKLWAQMLQTFLTEARRLHTQDHGGGTHLVRLGAYFHDETVVREDPPDAEADR